MNKWKLHFKNADWYVEINNVTQYLQYLGETNPEFKNCIIEHLFNNTETAYQEASKLLIEKQNDSFLLVVSHSTRELIIQTVNKIMSGSVLWFNIETKEMIAADKPETTVLKDFLSIDKS